MSEGAVTRPDGSVHELFPRSIPLEAGSALRDWVRKEQAATTLELGLGNAISSLFICQGLLLNGSPLMRHVSFDPWPDIGRQVIDEAGLVDLVEIHEEESQIGLAKLVEQDRRFDLAFVDGDHHFDGVFMDLVFVNRLVRPGGVVVVDDVWLPAVARAVRFVTTNLGWISEEEDVGGKDKMAVFRLPRIPPAREWDHYVDF